MALLEAVGLVKIFRGRRVVDGVDLKVNQAEIVGLLGPNGAGKTTSFRMICGLVQPHAGRVFLGDKEVTHWPMYRRCRDGRMGYLAQESSIFRKLSVEQNLHCVMELLHMNRGQRRARCEQLLEQFKITHIRKSKAAKLSGGERRRLEIARSLVSDPEIIMLDEPSLAEAVEPGFILDGEEVIDLISGALAAVEQRHISGLHSCAHIDWGTLLSTGARVLSVPVPSVNDDVAMAEMLVAASRISDHLEHGGRIAWGAVRTDGPIAISAERSWKSIVEVMCALVKAGVDPVILRRNSFVTPACGLATHSDGVAERVFAHAREVSVKVAEQATASRLTLGS